jgi:hypothetical protein
VQAAEDAGLPTVTLLEEPQAALYAWIDAAGEEWRRQIAVGDRCSSATSAAARRLQPDRAPRERRQLALERVAVGEHILLGGDNMDLALAHAVRERLAADGTTLDAWQTARPGRELPRAKEHCSASIRRRALPVAILGRGRKVVGGALRADVDRDDATALGRRLLSALRRSATPQTPRRTGLQELGLPYAADAAVTRHLATSSAAAPTRIAAPTAVLFNGGVMRAAALRSRLLDVLGGWYRGGTVRAPRRRRSEFAVARGAAYYGLARRGRGVRIRGGIARTFYVGIETAMPAVPGMRPPIKALCVVPHGLEEGQRGRAAVAGARPGGRRADRVPLPELDDRREDHPGVLLDVGARRDRGAGAPAHHARVERPRGAPSPSTSSRRQRARHPRAAGA